MTDDFFTAGDEMKGALVGLMTVLLLLAGCVEEEPAPVEEERSLPVASSFPAWQGVSHDNTSYTSEAFTNRSYLAYFSAPWCTHCETTLDAYDLTVPAEQVVVFSRDGREEYANMSEWHNTTEANLNRSVDRPFILHPDLAMEVEAKSIPHAVFVNPQGYAFHVEIGKETNQSYIQSVWELTQTAVFNETTGWNHHVESSD